MRKRVATALAAVATVAMSASMGAAPAYADHSQASVVSANPMDKTPNVRDGTVRDFAIVGNDVVVAGTFTTVRNSGSSTDYARRGIFAFDKTTGALDQSFTPTLNGNVNALVAGDNGTVYAGGSFTTVNGASVNGLTQLKLSDGKATTGFTKARLNGSVFALARSGNQLYAGGTFTKATSAAHAAVARLDASTGKADAGFNIQASVPWAGALRVGEIALAPSGDRLVMTGSFREVDGQSRPQIAMVDTGTTAKLSSWRTAGFGKSCQAAVDYYARDVDFSPDGDYFDVVSTGGHATTGADSDTLCDSATRWKSDATGTDVKPVWHNMTGGDSLYSVSDTGAAVYVGGHERWLDNPEGHDSKGAGAVDRPGIGAIDPSTGKALSWNPTRDRGHGVEALVASDTGLYVGSDTDNIGGEWHQKVAYFPLPDSSPATNTQSSTGKSKPDRLIAQNKHMPAGPKADDPLNAAGPAAAHHANKPAAAQPTVPQSNDLPFTGAPIALAAAVALALLIGGGGFMYYSRRMQRRKPKVDPLN